MATSLPAINITIVIRAEEVPAQDSVASDSLAIFTVTAGTTADGRSHVEIVDQGPGIPAAERARVLDRFYRVAGTHETGSGLGLSIAARIADLHGARFELADGPGGRGLCARVIFPSARSG